VTPKRSASAKGLEFLSKTLNASLRVADSLVTWIRLSVSRSQTCKARRSNAASLTTAWIACSTLSAFRIARECRPLASEKSRINSFVGNYRTVVRGHASQDAMKTEMAERSPIAV
jgi:hypothetical protein